MLSQGNPTVKYIIATNTGDTVHAAQLAARPDLHVLFVTEPRFISQYPVGTDIALVDDLNDPAAAARAVARQRPLGKYSHVVALSERAAPTAGCLRSLLALPGPSFDTIVNCTDKYAMKRRFRDAGLPTARFAMAGSAEQLVDAAEEVGYPVIVKPVVGAGVDATVVIQSAQEMGSSHIDDFLKRLSAPATTSQKSFPVLVEEYFDVIEEYHCDGYLVDGQVEYVQVSRYLRPVLAYSSGTFGSYLLDPAHPDAKAVREMHAQAVRSVGLRDGVTHFEVLRTSRGLFAGEIAGRPGGGGIRRMLQLDAGFDSWAAHIACSLGEPYQFDPLTQGPGEGQVMQVMLPSRRGSLRRSVRQPTFPACPDSSKRTSDSR